LTENNLEKSHGDILSPGNIGYFYGTFTLLPCQLKNCPKSILVFLVISTFLTLKVGKFVDLNSREGAKLSNTFLTNLDVSINMTITMG